MATNKVKVVPPAPAPERNLLILKLQSGEEILSEVVEEENGTLTLIRPFAILMHQDEFTGKLDARLVPFMMLSDKSIISITERPIAMSAPSDEGLNLYLKAIGEKIVQTPSKKIIT